MRKRTASRLWKLLLVVLAAIALFLAWDWLVVLWHQAPWRETWKKPGDFPTMLTVIAAAFVGGITIYITWKVDTWNRNKATIELASRWNDGEIAETREKFRRIIPVSPNKHYGKEFLRILFIQEPDMKSDLAIILNHLDIVAVALDRGIIHHKATNHLYGWVIVSWFNNFEDYIVAKRKESEEQNPKRPGVWSYLEEVALDLRGKRIGPNIDRRLPALPMAKIP